MAQPDFTLDDRQLQAFSRELKFERQSQVAGAIRSVLNDQAFSARKQGIEVGLPRTFNIRSSWVQSSVLVDKAQGRNIRTMQAVAGAKKNWRRNPGKPFEGLGEQERGEGIRDPVISTLKGRSGGVFSNRVRPTFRINRLGDIVDESEFSGSGEGRIITMLRVLGRQRFKGAFFIRTSRRIRKGIYKFGTRAFRTRQGERSKDIVMVKDLSRNRVNLPKRPWWKRSVDRAVNERTTARFWQRAFERYTRRTR
jgi:hypothetical protein